MRFATVGIGSLRSLGGDRFLFGMWGSIPPSALTFTSGPSCRRPQLTKNWSESRYGISGDQNKFALAGEYSDLILPAWAISAAQWKRGSVSWNVRRAWLRSLLL